MDFEKGKLVRWLEEKGFGFIKPDKGGADIFIHISAMRGMSRLPIVGDIIHYETSINDKGKFRAINVKIECVAQGLTVNPIDRKRNTHPQQKANRNNSIYKPSYRKSGSRFIPVLLVVVAFSIYSKLSEQYQSTEKSILTQIEPSKPVQQFQCQGKVYCSQMTSSEEATFYLHNCPGTKIDGDNDGIPCERQL
jgi:cold shock CspA family protein